MGNGKALLEPCEQDLRRRSPRGSGNAYEQDALAGAERAGRLISVQMTAPRQDLLELRARSKRGRRVR
jgi:hypothetical protein